MYARCACIRGLCSCRVRESLHLSVNGSHVFIFLFLIFFILFCFCQDLCQGFLSTVVCLCVSCEAQTCAFARVVLAFSIFFKFFCFLFCF